MEVEVQLLVILQVQVQVQVQVHLTPRVYASLAHLLTSHRVRVRGSRAAHYMVKHLHHIKKHHQQHHQLVLVVIIPPVPTATVSITVIPLHF